MKDRKLQNHLRQSLQHENVSYDTHIKLEETINLCIGIMREHRLGQNMQNELRTSFVQFLSDIFRFEGIPLLGLQAGMLFIICLAVSTAVDIPKYIPVFIPLLVLAAVPIIFKSQYYGMSEIEAATRASGLQILLAKLILAGAANLVCITILIFFEASLQSSYEEIGQMVLYCLVPYLVCMSSMLHTIRLHRKESIKICTITTLGSCAIMGVSAKTLPWLYETSAFGLWIVAFLFFAAFFIKEIYFIITMRKEGKTYGIIS